MCNLCLCIGKNMNFLCPAEVPLYEVCEGRAILVFRAPLLTTHSSDATTAMNTNSAMGQQEEALKQGSYLQKAGEKFGIRPPFWKLK